MSSKFLLVLHLICVSWSLTSTFRYGSLPVGKNSLKFSKEVQYFDLHCKVSVGHRRRSLVVKSLFDDDLPNVLGINPIEAAIIFGGLYYLYGPSKLYEFAKEAGRFVSTYGPVVQQAATDIFNEFREYLDEDQERALLRKAGIDVEKLPRRTTNIIERFQQSISALSESSEFAASSNTLQSAYRDIGETTTMGEETAAIAADVRLISSENGLRKRKREVLLDRNVDIDGVIEATEKLSQGSESDLTQSLSMIKESVEKLQRQPLADDTGSIASSTRSLAPPQESLPISKFQQQLSGEWNNRVMQRGQYSAQPTASSQMSEQLQVGEKDSFLPQNNDNFDADDNSDIILPYPPLPSRSFMDGDLGDVDDRLVFPNLHNDDVTTLDGQLEYRMEEELSSPSQPIPVGNAAIGDPYLVPPSSSTPPSSEKCKTTPSTASVLSVADAAQFLHSIDSDYLALRGKVLSFLRSQGIGEQDLLAGLVGLQSTPDFRNEGSEGEGGKG